MRLLLTALCCTASILAFAQKITITGKVFDKDTKEGIPFCNVYLEGTTQGTTTDDLGVYSLTIETTLDSLTASAMGYEMQRKPFNKNLPTQEINFTLPSAEVSIGEVVIYAGENPANAIVRNLIKNKANNRISKFDNYQCEAYTKVELDLDNIDGKIRKSKLFKPFEFVFNNIDSTSDEKPFLPAYIMENVSDVFHVKGEGSPKFILKAQRVSGVNNQTVVEFINSMHEDYDVYDNWIHILEKPFASPFSDLGMHYYEYYIQDSAVIDGKMCHKLKFKPKRKQENTFYGNFWVADTTYAVQRVDMQISRDVNINLVSRVIIYQEFNHNPQHGWLPFKQKTVLDFRPQKNTPGLIGRKTLCFKDFRNNQTAIIKHFQEKDVEDIDLSTLKKDDSFWQNNRQEKLSKNEESIYAIVDSVKNVPLYKTYVDLIYTFVSGYKELGNIEIGPYFTLYSKNPVEGHRFKLGVWTSNQFSKTIRFGGYLGYGTKDKALKYGADLQWNISKNPRSTLDVAYKRDIQFTHVNSEEIGEGNLFSGVYRRPLSQKLVFVEEAKVGYEKYWKKGWSNRLTLLNMHLDPYDHIYEGGGGFNYKFLPNPDVTSLYDSTLTTTELTLKVKYAYKEKFLDGAFSRVSIGSKYPILELQYAAGIKGILGGDYNYHKLTLQVNHWFNIRPIGWSRYVFKAGKTFGRVPFLLAEVHPGNETYFYNANVFNGMNRYEFASDAYMSLLYTHHFDGFFLNKIPLLRKLKWREVVAFRAVWGSMNSENREANQLNLYNANLNGKETYTGFRVPAERPYMETGVGIENILKVFRVDALWRLNYLDNPDADRFTFRVGIEFYF